MTPSSSRRLATANEGWVVVMEPQLSGTAAAARRLIYDSNRRRKHSGTGPTVLQGKPSCDEVLTAEESNSQRTRSTRSIKSRGEVKVSLLAADRRNGGPGATHAALVSSHGSKLIRRRDRCRGVLVRVEVQATNLIRRKLGYEFASFFKRSNPSLLEQAEIEWFSE